MARRQASKYVLPRKMRLPMRLLCGTLVLLALAVYSNWSPTDSGVTSALRASHAGDSRQAAAASASASASAARSLQQDAAEDESLYPQILSEETRGNGAIVLHIIGTLYMFVALAIVCDEYFVPALEVITERVKVSDDVAGATFMAAGGSAPELFTSFIGVFISKSNVGFGTIVGSAVFNVLFVIGMCAIFSRELLELTWWPLFRDATYYSISLIVLVITFWDSRIKWWEAVILFAMYLGYVGLMAYNQQLYKLVMSCFRKQDAAVVPVEEVLDVHDPKDPSKVIGSWSHKRTGVISLMNVPTTFRAGVMHIMLQHTDPIGKGTDVDKEKRFSRLADICRSNVRLRRVLSETANKPKGQLPSLRELSTPHSEPNVKTPKPPREAFAGPILEASGGPSAAQVAGSTPNASGDVEAPPSGGAGEGSGTTTESGEVVSLSTDGGNNGDGNNVVVVSGAGSNKYVTNVSGKSLKELKEDRDDADDEEYDIHWPKDGNLREKITYVLIFPLSLLMYFTIPDVRKERWENWYPVTFLTSILWIGVFSYLMVWWATVIGVTFGIPDQVMGLTFLAAGTSVPDLLSSVIVARQGLGDMAVSSSIGSNIFDILVGLPIPWLCSIIAFGEDISVTATGLQFSVMVLFIMLVLVVITIAASRWKMTKTLGGAMFVLYGLFVALNLMVEYGVITPPTF